MCVCVSPGDCGSVSEESPGGPCEPAASSRPCSTDMAVVPRNASVTLQASGGDSFSSSQSFAADDIGSVTISDLYAGMLHSMSRLLGAKPASIISTKTFIVRNWTSRRRHGCRSRAHGPRPGGGRRGAHGRSHHTLLPCSEPGKGVGVLRDCQNVREKAGLKLEKARLDVNTPQICTLQPSRKAPAGTPQQCASLTYIDSIATHRLDQENRLMTLQWLISPVKIFSRRRMQQGGRGNHHRELANRFAQLHQEYCPSPRKQPCLASPRASAVRAPGASPGGPGRAETRGPSRPFSSAQGKSLNEAFENLGKRAAEAGTCLAKSSSSPSLLRANPAQKPGSSERTAGLSHGNNLGILRKSVFLSEALSVPGVRPLGCAKDRYDEIKEKFDKLHQKYCQKSPQQTKTPLCIGASPGKASVEVWDKNDSLGKLNLVSGFPGPHKLPASPHWSIKRSPGSTTVVHPATCFALTARRGPQPLAKRRRLSDPQVCGRWDAAQGPARRPGDEVGSLQLD